MKGSPCARLLEHFGSYPPGDGDAKVPCLKELSPGELLRGARSLTVVPFLGVPLTCWLSPQVLEHPRVSGSQGGKWPVACPLWEARRASSHSSAPRGTSFSMCCPSCRFPGLAQPHAAPPQPGHLGFVQPYKGEPVRAALCPRNWLIIKQKQNSPGVKLDLCKACRGRGILHNFWWWLFFMRYACLVGISVLGEQGVPML